MSDLDWGNVNVDENVSEEDHKNSEDISKKLLIGKFLCTITEVKPEQKDFTAYSCIAANLKMRIESVLAINMPILDDNGNQNKHPQTKELLFRKTPVPEGDESYNDKIAGQFIFDSVNLYNSKEKEGTKNRRLFVARKIGILGESATSLTAADWANAEGRMVIVETELNAYTPQGSTEVKKNQKVMWEGYESADSIAEEEVNIDDL